MSARLDRSQALTRRIGQRDQDAVDLLGAANALDVGGRPEDAQRTNRSTDELRVVVDEADDDGVAERAAFELERERDALVGRADDERAQSCAAAVTLTLEREQPGLEPDAAATQENEQRGNRRGAEQWQRHVPYVGVPRELEGRYEDARGDRGDDPHGLLDRRVAPNRSVEPDDLIEEELRRDRDQQIRKGTAYTERCGAGETREIAEEPRRADDAEVEDAQARRSPSASYPVYRTCQPMRIRGRIRALIQRRRRESTHPCSPRPPLSQALSQLRPARPQIFSRSAPSVNQENA